MTNLQLTVMIAAYCGSPDTDHYKDTEVYRDQVESLLNDGMIKPSHNIPNYYKFAITDKGKFWLDTVLKMPYPVEIKEWRISNESE